MARYPTGKALLALRYPQPPPIFRPPAPPEHIRGTPEEATWHDLAAEHRIDDGLGLEIILTVVEAMRRARRFREIIDRDGEMIDGEDGKPHRHPLLVSEIASRAAVLHAMRTLMK